jgi:hypothetical protein
VPKADKKLLVSMFRRVVALFGDGLPQQRRNGVRARWFDGTTSGLERTHHKLVKKSQRSSKTVAVDHNELRHEPVDIIAKRPRRTDRRHSKRTHAARLLTV